MSVVESFVPGEIYKATVVKQELGLTKAKDPQLVLHLRLLGQLENPKRPQGATLPLSDSLEKEIRIFVPFVGDENKMRNSAFAMKALDFQGEDIQTLSPDHAKFQNFVGKTVFAKPREWEEKIYWDLKAYPVFNNPAPTNELKQFGRNNGTAWSQALENARNPKAKETANA